LAEDDERVLPVQINGKRRTEIRAAAGTPGPEVERIALSDAEVRRHLGEMAVRKVIVVPDRIVNIVAG
jgi:leucyl-tRNA synthetase